MKIKFPEAQLFSTFSLVVTGLADDGSTDNLRVSFVIFPRLSDSFKVFKQLTIGIVRVGGVPIPNILFFLIAETIMLVLVVPRDFTGKFIVIILLSALIFALIGLLTFEACRYAACSTII